MKLDKVKIDMFDAALYKAKETIIQIKDDNTVETLSHLIHAIDLLGDMVIREELNEDKVVE